MAAIVSICQTPLPGWHNMWTAPKRYFTTLFHTDSQIIHNYGQLCQLVSTHALTNINSITSMYHDQHCQASRSPVDTKSFPWTQALPPTAPHSPSPHLSAMTGNIRCCKWENGFDFDLNVHLTSFSYSGRPPQPLDNFLPLHQHRSPLYLGDYKFLSL